MGYLIFNGWRTTTADSVPASLSPAGNMLTNTYVSQMPSHKKGAMRYTEYYVKGRDGALHVDEGYENFDMTVILVLLNASVNARYSVNAWADGTGKLISSDDLTKAYKASVKEAVEWQRVKANAGFYDTATITFNCEPYMVEAVDSQTTLTGTGSILNPGDMVSYPMIQVNGSGDVTFSVNGNVIQIDDMTANVPVYIDCSTGYVYTASGATSLRGEIPSFSLGTNTITFGEGLTSLVITPHWRWI